MGDMLRTFYLWMLSKMTLHPQTPLSEKGEKRETIPVCYMQDRLGQKMDKRESDIHTNDAGCNNTGVHTFTSNVNPTKTNSLVG